jgi:hypothetical protein
MRESGGFGKPLRTRCVSFPFVSNNITSYVPLFAAAMRGRPGKAREEVRAAKLGARGADLPYRPRSGPPAPTVAGNLMARLLLSRVAPCYLHGLHD